MFFPQLNCGKNIERSAEGASLEQAKPDETLRQKDPVPNHSGKFLCVKSSAAKDTDGATHHW
jgi:hypothetical protein